MLNKDFYKKDTLNVAKELLGKNIVRNINGHKLVGRIVETEAYIGPFDKAAHSYNNRKTQRNEVMFKDAGHAYIYFIYGMYYCFNIVTEDEGKPCAVLIRAIEPIEGIDYMFKLRYKKELKEISKSQFKNLTNGPSKLCIALNLDKSLNGINLFSDTLYVEDAGYNDFDIVETTRINIDYAEEARFYPWRFYIKDNPWVSQK
ncbi:DNA-3-methyladenine glycosylase [Caloramator proteoclasticus]|uniref:Putative 3-methyladenine DNA glycosylase n=1 Tax=Caloramator proteoclasticus DSM 10124 TaxID=1121262 RepID=A0A1M4W6M1_9CLOT|nr:DNA-3-methyladenine glycosylase [Caloramator proteoclasticus]SHE76857.1 DNA-3-methyladenine glycosylase [Caloramator proteoclasticus DSM 10124]